MNATSGIEGKRPVGGHWFLGGVFLLCMSVLMIQIIQTRILSVTTFYYMAFFSISMAMLGLTAGALFVFRRFDRIQPSDLPVLLARLTAAFALCLLLCFLAQLSAPLVVLHSLTTLVVWIKMIVLLSLPFAFAGAAISLALAHGPGAVGTTYGVDLLGAAGGCLASLALMTWLDAPSAMFMVAAIAAAAAWCFERAGHGAQKEGSLFDWLILRKPALLAIALAALSGLNASTKYGLQPLNTKYDTIEPFNSYKYVKWNSFSRITVPPLVKGATLWGPSPTLPKNLDNEERLVAIDLSSASPMPRYSPAPGAMDFLRYDISNFGFYGRHEGRAAIVGAGSGRDLLAASLFGFHDITGIELNPILIDLITDPAKLRGEAGVADLPGVKFVCDEARSWFARTNEKFDLIHMSMTDTWAATGAGAYSLSENGLYTVEGWRTFLSALTPDGLFTVTRWHSPDSTVELGRVVSLGLAALMSMGVERPIDNIYIVSLDNVASVIISRAPLTGAQLDALDAAAAKLKFTVLARPGVKSADPVIAGLMAARDLRELETRSSGQYLDLSPATDARPFFFNQLRFTSLHDLAFMYAEWRKGKGVVSGSGWDGNLIAVGTLLLIVVLSAVFVAAVLLWPTGRTSYGVAWPLFWSSSLYFLLIGAGFMFVEIGVIQRLTILLGHPAYAMSIGLFGLILATGVGSLFAGRLRPNAPALMAWLGALVAYLLVLPCWMPAVIHSSLGLESILARGAVSVAIIAPAGLLMGLAFPAGIRLVDRDDGGLTPWLWGLNGAASVLSAGLAVACSIGFSIDVTIRAAGIFYAGALAAVWLFHRRLSENR